MLLRPTRIVRATTEQELDSALGSADQVIVEGDGRLLSYAVARASSDPQNRIDVKIGGQYAAGDSVIVGTTDTRSNISVFLLLGLACLVAVFAVDGHVTIVAMVALFLIAAIARGRNVEIRRRATRRLDDDVRMLPLWLHRGSPVWKVTEKVTGRVVITKVRTRATKQGALAAMDEEIGDGRFQTLPQWMLRKRIE
jgi:hypothetical protein